MRKTLLGLISLVLGFGTLANAQTILTMTTLSGATGNTASSALTTGNLGVLSVASATGISAPAPNTSNTMNTSTSGGQTYLYVDRELMQVVNVSGTTITVIRGLAPTAAASHASGAVVFVVPAADIYGGSARLGAIPEGSCTRTNELYLPHIQFETGIISDCLGGQWVNGDGLQTTRASFYRYQQPNTGAQASSAVFGTNSTLVQYDLYCTELDLPFNKLLTGLAPHIGTTGGTDKWIVGLYDSTGNLIAQSAAAGATVGSGYAWQAEAFTSQYYAVGPAQYFGCFMTNGTTATADLVTTAKGDNVLTKIYTNASFVLPTTITVPTAFTTVNGPYNYAY